MSDYTIEYDELHHPYFGHLRRRKDAGFLFGWSKESPPLVDWIASFKFVVDYPEDRITIGEGEKRSHEVEIAFTRPDSISDAQVSAWSRLQSFNPADSATLLAESLYRASEPALTKLIDNNPSLEQEVQRVREVTPFPTGEFVHFSTEIAATEVRGESLVVLLIRQIDSTH
jgi:hypothetical protein